MISFITAYLALALSVLGPLELQEEQLKKDLLGYKLADVELKGKTIFDLEKLESVLGMKNGDPYDPQLIEKGLENLRQFFFDNGYIDFTYIPQLDIDHNKKSVSCSFELFPGRQYFVRRISFYGSRSKEDDKVIRSALNGVLEEGMVFSSKRLDNAIKILDDFLETRNLIVKVYELKRSSKNSTVDIYITLQFEDR